MQTILDYLTKNSLVMSFLFIGGVMLLSQCISKYLTRGRIHASAIAIIVGLFIAYIGGVVTRGSQGIADVAVFSGVGVLGGAMFRDFTIIATSFGADLDEFKKYGRLGIIALFAGVTISFLIGLVVALVYGYRDLEELTVIAAGTVSFIVGPITATALGVTSEVVAISIAAGVIKSTAIMICTPLVAKHIGLNTPKAALVYGAMLGSTSGISAGLAATDERLVPYGAMMATFYLGLGCLLCPTLLYWLTQIVLSLFL